MLLNKPQVSRVVITARDADAELPSKSVTVYETTPDQAMAIIEILFAAASHVGAKRVREALRELEASPAA